MVKTFKSDGSSDNIVNFLYTEKSSQSILLVRFLGMGFLIAWLCCTHVLSIFPGLEEGMAFRDFIDIVMRFADIGTFCAFALLASRIGKLSAHPLFCFLSIVVTSFGTAFLGLVLVPLNVSELLVGVCGVFTAIGGAVLFCLWAELYVQMGPVRVMVYGALSCVVAFLSYFIVSTMMQPYALILTSLFPLISAACAFWSFKAVPSEQKEVSGVRYPVPWKLYFLMVVAGFLSALSGALLPEAGGYGAIHRVQVTGLAGVSVLVMFFVLKERCDVRLLAKICLPMAAIGFVLVPFIPFVSGFFVSFFIKFAYVWFTFFVLMMIANLAYRFEVPSLRLFSIARASSETAILMGVLLREPIRLSGFVENDFFLYGSALLGLGLLAVCAFVWTREKSVNKDWGIAGISIENGLRVPGSREQIMHSCEKIAKEYGLTSREGEILGLLAQQKTRTEIGQELFLSENTIKTHIRNLYAKMDIHSKEDIYRLVKI